MGIPKVHIVGPMMGGFALLVATPGGGTCAPTFYLDGRRTVLDELHAFRPQHVARVEVYARPSTAPLHLPDIGINCGVIAVWTTTRP